MIYPAGDSFTIPRAAVTLWNMQSGYGTQRLIVDLYLEIQPAQRPRLLQEFLLAVPFDLAEDGKDIDDLSKFLSDNDRKAQLPPWVVDETWRESGPIAIAAECMVERVENRQTVAAPIRNKSDVSSEVRVKVHPPPSGDNFALLIRFHVGTQSALALWKRSLLGINGLIADLRFSRGEGGITPSETTLSAVIRATFQPHFTVPAQIDPTVIENDPWRPYLARNTDRRSEAALIAYTTRESGEQDDHRLYLDLSREFGLLPFGNFIRIFLVALAAWFTGYVIVENRWRGIGPVLIRSISRAADWVWREVFNRAQLSVALGFKLTGVVAVLIAATLFAMHRSKARIPGILRPMRLAVARYDRRRQHKRVSG